MSNEAGSIQHDDPLKVLGLPRHASEQEVRRRYLELVRQYPPERDPLRFQQIHAAYKAAEDPLLLAKCLLTSDDSPPREWNEIINEQKAIAPRLGVSVLLSLGNRPSSLVQASTLPSETSEAPNE